MYETLALMNARLLLWLNHWLAAHPTLFAIAQDLTDEGADVALLATAAWLWFWPDRVAPDASPGRAARYATETPMTRHESRARLLVFGIAGVLSYVTARLIAIELDMARPFVTYLPVRGNPGAFEGLRTFGAFPSDHAALLAALPIAFRYWSRTLSNVWVVLAVFLIIVRIAVGFHYPSDMLAGAVIGMVYVSVAMLVYDFSRAAQRRAIDVAVAFAQPRSAMLLYPLLGLVGVEFAMHFRHLLRAILMVREWLA